MYEQAAIAVENHQVFHSVKGAIDAAFSSGSVDNFLRSLERGKFRIRDFEEIAGAGKLGTHVASEYKQLGDGDQGMIREHYLSTLEKVDPDLRGKYLKVYAYY